MKITDDPTFQYGYRSGVYESLSQIDKLVESASVKHGWEIYEKRRQTVEPTSVRMFEDGWACGSITVKAAAGNWLKISKLYINYRQALKDIVKDIATKYRFEMVLVDDEFDDEIRTAIFFQDITRGINDA